MSRINEIQSEIIETVQSKPELAEASSTSVTSIWNLFTYVAAFFSLNIENLFLEHKTQVNTDLRNLKPSKPTWYQNMALKFQYGSDLAEGVDYYDNSNLTDDQVIEQLIIAQAAVTENAGNLTIKITKEVDEELEPLSIDEYNAFSSYMEEVKDGGVNLVLLSFEPDRLKMEVDIHYNPVILDSSGQRIDGTNDSPVESLINSFLRTEVKYDGQFVLSDLGDKLKDIDGVEVPVIRDCKAARFDNANFVEVDVKYKPYSGFLRIYNNTDLVINYIEWDV